MGRHRTTRLGFEVDTARAARGGRLALLVLTASVSACAASSSGAVASPSTATQATTSLQGPATRMAGTSAPLPAPTSPAVPRAPLDAGRIAAATGGKAESSDSVVRVTFPRDDVRVEVDGWAKVRPFMGLTSWTAFVPAEKPQVEAMVMGDLVLFEDEVNAAMSAALDNGLEVTALHNHFFFDKPRVLFMHIGGEGSVDALANGVKAALDAVHAVRKKTPQPGHAFGAAPPSPSQIDAAKLDTIFGVKGAAKDGMYKGTFGRKTQAECGCTIGKAMGVATWAAFGGTDADAIVDGDFAVAEGELQGLLKSLRGGAINVVAIHSHMAGESPRLLFVHYWGRGHAADLAAAVKRALDLTDWDGKSPAT